jgi:hypothetical protein
MKNKKVNKLSNSDIKELRLKIKNLIVDQWNYKKDSTEYISIGKEILTLEDKLKSYGETLSTNGTIQSQIERIKSNR